MSVEVIGNTKNGKKVYFDTEKSHAVTHIQKNPKLLEYVKRVLPSIDAIEEFVRMDFDMGEVVGEDVLVETQEGDEIVYALRPLRQVHSRFVKGKESVPTSFITIALNRQHDGDYSLYTVFIGRLVPSFPGGNFRPEESREFWSNHALVWGSRDVVPGTETTECPWR